MTKITNAVFMGLFFNTGILFMLTNANLSDISPKLGRVFDNEYYDYSPRWYAMVGATLVQTMFINAFMPPIFEILTNVQVWIYQVRDSGWRCCTNKATRMYKTRKTQIFDYIDLYSGPEYIIHYKQAQVLNIVFVTMMYGLGMPILFPIAFISFFIIYATERF